MPPPHTSKPTIHSVHNPGKALSTYVLKKSAEFLGLWIYPWKFQIKQSFTPAKYCYTSWKFQDPWKFLDFYFLFLFLITLEIPLLSCPSLALGISTCYFSNNTPENSSIMSSTPSSVWILYRITHCQHILTISNAFWNNSKMFRMYECLIWTLYHEFTMPKVYKCKQFTTAASKWIPWGLGRSGLLLHF